MNVHNKLLNVYPIVHFGKIADKSIFNKLLN